MMMPYQHTQNATLTTAILAAVLLFTLGVAVVINQPFVWWMTGLTATIVALVGWLFSSLTVEVDADELRWHFGPGFWRKKLARSDIAEAAPVKTKWWYGWGIRITPKGWLYNVSGFDVVAVTDRAGKTRLIGTDEPNRLATALRG